MQKELKTTIVLLASSLLFRADSKPPNLPRQLALRRSLTSYFQVIVPSPIVLLESGSTDIETPLSADLLFELFSYLGGNVKSVADAQVIFFGDNHIEFEHEGHIAEMLVQYGKPGDVVLVEGIELGTEIDPIEYYQKFDVAFKSNGKWVDNGLRFVGWENLRLFQKGTELSQALNMSQLQLLVARKHSERLKLSNDIRSIRASLQENFRLRSLSLHFSVEQQLSLLPPESRLWIFAGTDHFTKDLILQQQLENGVDFLALGPK